MCKQKGHIHNRKRRKTISGCFYNVLFLALYKLFGFNYKMQLRLHITCLREMSIKVVSFMCWKYYRLSIKAIKKSVVLMWTIVHTPFERQSSEVSIYISFLQKILLFCWKQLYTWFSWVISCLKMYTGKTINVMWGITKFTASSTLPFFYKTVQIFIQETSRYVMCVCGFFFRLYSVVQNKLDTY